MRRIAFCLVAVLTLAACGSAGKSSQATTPPSSTTSTTAVEQGVKEASDRYLAAFLGGDEENAYALVSTRCQQAQSKEAFAPIVQAAAALYGTAKDLGSEVTMVDNDHAVVIGKLDTPALNSPDGKKWTRENGSWKWDAC